MTSVVMAISYVELKIYCRSNPMYGGTNFVTFGWLKHFVHFDYVVHALTEMCHELETSVKQIKNITDEDVKKAMLSHEPITYRSAIYFNDKNRIYKTIDIISNHTKKHINLFLDYLMNGLDHGKIMTMEEKHFRIIYGIFRELWIPKDHPLHKSLLFRLIYQMLHLKFSDSLLSIIAEYSEITS